MSAQKPPGTRMHHNPTDPIRVLPDAEFRCGCGTHAYVLVARRDGHATYLCGDHLLEEVVHAEGAVRVVERYKPPSLLPTINFEETRENIAHMKTLTDFEISQQVLILACAAGSEALSLAAEPQAGPGLADAVRTVLQALTTETHDAELNPE